MFCFVFVFFFESFLQQLPIRGIWVKSLVKTFWFIAEEQWTDNDWVSDRRVSHVTFQKLCEEQAPFIEKIERKVTKS